jgi:hypothetical protein
VNFCWKWPTILIKKKRKEKFVIKNTKNEVILDSEKQVYSRNVVMRIWWQNKVNKLWIFLAKTFCNIQSWGFWYYVKNWVEDQYKEQNPKRLYFHSLKSHWFKGDMRLKEKLNCKECQINTKLENVNPQVKML